jgi:PAS domain S-box-containing protein
MSMDRGLQDLIAPERLQSFISSLHQALGIHASVTDLDGRVIVESPAYDICGQFHRRHPPSMAQCLKSDSSLAAENLRGNASCLYKCLNGLYHAISAVTIGGRHVANIFCGQFLTAPPDVESFRAQAALYGFDERGYLAALSQVPVIDEGRVSSILAFITSTASMLGEMGLERLRQRETEESLQKTQNLYSIITEYTSDAVWTMDMDFRTTWATPSVIRNRGYSVEELAAMPIEEHLAPASLAKALEVIAAEMTPEKLADRHCDLVLRDEFEYRCKDGRTIWAATVVKLQRDRDGNPSGFLCSSHDITAYKRAEAALREADQRYRMLTEHMHDAVWLMDMDLRTTWVTPSVIRNRGYSFEELAAMPLEEHLTPSSLQRVTELVATHLTPENLADPGREIVITCELEYTVKGGGTVWGDTTVKLIRDAQGRPREYLCTEHDITERKRLEAERVNMEERLRRSEKMEALGTLAGGVAHDLNNVLGVLVGYSELLLQEIPEEMPLRGCVADILTSSEQAAAIIQDLLTLARRGVAVEKVVCLNDVIAACLASPEFERLRSRHPRVAFRHAPGEDLLNVKGSAVHLGKTVMNLLANAAEAIAGTGEVVIATENRYLDRQMRGYDEIHGGEYAVLRVSDTGRGIAPEEMGKIFEPFYTKKVMGRHSGTGLGLAVVWGTVKDHGGYIDVESSEGEGSAFTLYLPVTREAMAAEEEPAAPETYRGRSETILVVDDVREQRELAVNMLNRLGYRAAAVAGGEAAVEYLLSKECDLLLLDMIMDPGIDGLETYRRILASHPRQKAILVSGFSETDRVREAQRLGAGAYVRKPYLIEKIGLAVRNTLDGPPLSASG